MALEVQKVELAFEAIDYYLSIFLQNDQETETAFPNALGSCERDFVLSRISRLEGITFSIAHRRDREVLTLHKDSAHFHPVKFHLSQTSREGLNSLMITKIPKDGGHSRGTTRTITCGNRTRTIYKPRWTSQDDCDTISTDGCGNRIHINYTPTVPLKRNSDRFAEHRQSLPIWKYQGEIMDNIANHRVIVVSGRSGSGKSTQIPQFILDSATSSGTPTKILSAQPHRLNAIAACNCVTRERGERVGVSIGYQARLESCYSPCASNLLFSTSELFLRSLIPPAYPVLTNVTHVILDDIHLRDATSDFVLACLLPLMRVSQFRLILLCAEMDSRRLVDYLGNAGVTDWGFTQMDWKPAFIPRVFYLSDIKKMVGKSQRQLVKIPPTPVSNSMLDYTNGSSLYRSPLDTDTRCKCCNLFRSGHLANVLIQKYVFWGDPHAADQFIDLVLRHEVSVNAQHSDTGMSLVVAAALKGDILLMDCLLELGADLFLDTGIKEYAIMYLLQKFRQPLAIRNLSRIPLWAGSLTLPELKAGPVDLKLILKLVQFIHSGTPMKETILVFLSSYDEIVTLKEMLFQNTRVNLDPQSFVVSLLHVNIPCGDERFIFEPPNSLVRKIILSTDVADTISVKDVVHVIDAGYTEKRTYNPDNSATGNRKVLISKSDAMERMRQNTFRVYDQEMFETMPAYRSPNFTQLQELCLYSTSLLKRINDSKAFFEDFLSPPPEINLKRSFEELIEIGALDRWKKMTPLGCYLLDFPIEPRLAKALIYASVLRCLDPVLTIVAVLSHRDPFKTALNQTDRVKIRTRKEMLSSNTFSDHMAMLQAYLAWENESGNPDNSSLRLNFVSPGIFDMVCAIRTDLLGQLRAFGFVRIKGIGNVKDLNQNAHNWSVVKAALIGALYPNVMKINPQTWASSNTEFTNARFHPSSSIARDPMAPASLPSYWLLYDEVNQSKAFNFCKGCTLVSSFALFVFGGSPTKDLELESSHLGHNERGHQEEGMRVILNKTVVFEGSRSDVELVLKIRKKFQQLVEKQLRRPGTLMSSAEERDLQIITLILTTEDRAAGLSQIDGIGQWPRFAGGSLLSVPCQGFTKSVSDTSAGTQQDDD